MFRSCFAHLCSVSNRQASHPVAKILPFLANQIRNVEFVNADTKLVKCLIDNVHVDLSENKVQL